MTATTAGTLPEPIREDSPLARIRGILAKPEFLAVLLIVAATAFRIQGTVDPDVSWQLWIAERVHHGARLYRDIVEINPPLWFWMALPVDSVAQLLGVRSDAVMIGAIGALAALSLIATGRLLTSIPYRRRSLFLTYAALVLFAMPWMHIGQREQIVLIGALPYTALIAARSSGRSIAPILALAIGAGAAIGFALKHYFLLVPALLELWFFLVHRRSWRAQRPEVAALLAVGSAYACALLIWGRDFLTLMLPLIRLAYGTTGAPHFLQIFGPPIWIALLITGFIGLYYRPRTSAQAPLTTALLIGATGFAAAYFIQSKGWTYHSIPFLGFVALALASMLAEIAEAPRPFRVIGPALLALPIVMAVQERRAETLPSPELVRSVASLPPGTAVGFLATEPAIAWSVTLQHHLRFPSRYYGFWMLRAIVRNEHRQYPDPRLEGLRQQVIDQTTVDFRCIAPRRILVSRPAPNGTDKDAFDILPFFLEDPEFAALFAHYRSIGRGPGLDVYDLAIPLAAPGQASCRHGV